MNADETVSRYIMSPMFLCLIVFSRIIYGSKSRCPTLYPSSKKKPSPPMLSAEQTLVIKEVTEALRNIK